jgi:hypothetical protein
LRPRAPYIFPFVHFLVAASHIMWDFSQAGRGVIAHGVFC